MPEKEKAHAHRCGLPFCDGKMIAVQTQTENAVHGDKEKHHKEMPLWRNHLFVEKGMGHSINMEDQQGTQLVQDRRNQRDKQPFTRQHFPGPGANIPIVQGLRRGLFLLPGEGILLGKGILCHFSVLHCMMDLPEGKPKGKRFSFLPSYHMFRIFCRYPPQKTGKRSCDDQN